LSLVFFSACESRELNLDARRILIYYRIVQISDIKPQQRNKNRVSVYLDGRYAFSLDYDTLSRAGLHIGDTVTDELREHLLQSDEYARVRDYAYMLLSYRSRTEYELRTRLLDRGFRQGSVREVLHSLKQSGLVDDRSFAEKWVEDMHARRPMGRLRAETELMKRRIRDDIIRDVCEKAYAEDTEARLGREAPEKKLAALRSYPEEEVKKKLFSFLQRRGFDFGVIHNLMKEFFRDDIG
jgi:regulatory protein